MVAGWTYSRLKGLSHQTRFSAASTVGRRHGGKVAENGSIDPLLPGCSSTSMHFYPFFKTGFFAPRCCHIAVQKELKHFQLGCSTAARFCRAGAHAQWMGLLPLVWKGLNPVLLLVHTGHVLDIISLLYVTANIHLGKWFHHIVYTSMFRSCSVTDRIR